MKDALREDFAATLAAVAARLDEWTWRCAGAAIDHAAAGGDVLVIAFGKAARRMAHSLLSAVPHERVRGLLVPPEPDTAPLPPLEVVAGGHPLPTAGSFRAAQRALALCAAATANEHVVFLVSGGGSALLELPLDRSVGVDAWRAFYRALIGCGAPIDRINRIRRRLSAVKGGRLAFAARGAAGQTTIVLKDVPGPVEDVASGPSGHFAAEPDTLAADLQQLRLVDALPPALAARAIRRELPPLPELPDEVLAHAAWLTPVDEFDARRHFAARLAARGVEVDQDADVDDWPYERAADELLARLDALARMRPGRPVALVTSGELSVPLPEQPGVGGRNLQFALACAVRIAGRPITVLSCGTDGVDGSSPAAGAVVDGTSAARARAAGLDPAAHLARCDAFSVLRATGDAVVIGPTGVNVRDLRALVFGS